MDNGVSKLSIRAFSFAGGFAIGYIYLLIGWAAYFYIGSNHIIELMTQLYPGFGPTFLGGLMGFFWGFIEGFILGFLIAGLYNMMLGTCFREVAADE